MRIGIVMPTINLWARYTKPAIDSVVVAMEQAEAASIETRFLLINNGSTDETDASINTIVGGPKSFFTERFLYKKNDEMWGFQRSVNYGVNSMLEAGMDIVLVLNNDIVMHPQAITRLVERFGRGGVAMVTCMNVRGECADNPNNLASLSDVEKQACPENPHPDFSAFAINRECWETAGEFDEVFHPAYYEDNDYHYRIQLAGLLAITYPPAMFFHYGSRTQLEAIGRPLTQTSNQHAEFIRKWGADPGHEVFKTPYNNGSPITSVKQNSK